MAAVAWAWKSSVIRDGHAAVEGDAEDPQIGDAEEGDDDLEDDDFRQESLPKLSDREPTALDIYEETSKRWEFFRLSFLLAVTVPVLALVAMVVYTEGVVDVFMYICLGVIVGCLLVFLPLRCFHVAPATYDVPLAALLTWLLCVVLCLAPESRKRGFYGSETELAWQDDLCEEGAVVLWIILVLALLAAFLPMRSLWYSALIQLVCLTYLALGIALPRPECADRRTSRGALSGPLLGMTPLANSVVQLYSVAAVLMYLQYQITAERQVETVAAFFLRGGNFRRSTTFCSETGSTEEVVFQIGLETVLEGIEREEDRWRRFLREVRRHAPWGSTCSTWITVVGVLVEVISVWREQLKSQAGGRELNHQRSFVDKVMDLSQGDCETVQAAVSSYVTDAIAENMNNHPLSTFRKESSHMMRSTDAIEVNKTKSVDSSSGTTSGSTTRSAYSKSIRMAALNNTDLQIGEWEFDALGIDSKSHHVLQLVGLELLKTFPFFSHNVLVAFLDGLECKYHNNPYHSHIHAADMCNSFFYLAQRSGLWRSCDMADLQYAAMLIAALGHDVGHPGRNNLFLVGTRHDLALTYSDRSVLENFHAATLVRMMESPIFENSRLLANAQGEQVAKARHLLTHLILSTDTSKHIEELGAFRFRLGAEGFDPFTEQADMLQVFSMFFRSADIGHSAKNWELHQEWSARVTEEFHQQGDEEKQLGLKVSPLCERDGFKLAAAQVGFLQFVCLPTWRELSKLEEGSLKSPSHHSSSVSSRIRMSVRSVRTSVNSKDAGMTRTESPGPGGSPRSGKGSPPITGKGSPVLGSALSRPKSLHGVPLRSGKRLATTPAAPTATTPVVPMASTVKSLKSLRTSMIPAPRCLTVCLTRCEENYQNWKLQQEVDRSEAGSHLACPSPRTQRRPSTSGRSDLSSLSNPSRRGGDA